MKKPKKEETAAQEQPPVPVREPEPSPPPVEVADGPTHIDPIPPPALAGEAPKRKRGRPPGSGNKPKMPGAAAKPIIGLDDLKRDMAKASALAVGMAHGTKWAPLAESIGWHTSVEVFDETRREKVPAIAPSDRLTMALEFMGPYLEESGALSLAQLSNEGKAIIGCVILAGPTVLAGFAMLATWAFKRPPAAKQTVKANSVKHSCPGCHTQEGEEHKTGCLFGTGKVEIRPEVRAV